MPHLYHPIFLIGRGLLQPYLSKLSGGIPFAVGDLLAILLGRLLPSYRQRDYQWDLPACVFREQIIHILTSPSACDSGCSSCIGSANSCTRCTNSSLVAYNGSCINTCPSGSINSSGTCQACSSDCATCSLPGSASSCLACPSSRPVLSNGRCIEYCPKSSYFDAISSTCRTCDTSCGSCIGPRSSQCTGCPDDLLLQYGSCVPASCGKGGFASGLGVCLSNLVTKADTNMVGLAAIPVVLVLFAAGFWYVRRERRKIRQATKEFAEVLDERAVRDRTMVLRLERVLGLNRVSPEPTPLRTENERKRLRDLLLPSRKRDKDIPLDERKIDKLGNDRRGSHWFAPPPPYMPSPLGSPITAGTTGMVDEPGCKTKVISMSSPTSPDYAPRPLFPPPRPRINTNRRVLREGGTSEVWPPMDTSPLYDESIEGEGSGRREHTWI